MLWIGTLLAVFGLICGLLVFWRVPVLQADRQPVSSVSIVIPARNEEKNLQSLLCSIERQQGVRAEVIVVDDGSTDRTAEIARSYGAAVYSNEILDEGWIGKSAACWTGAQLARNELLLFMDADTVFTAPDSLAVYMSAYESAGGTGILSLQPMHRAERWYEQLALLFPLIVMAGMNVFTVLGDRLAAGGSFGPCLLCDRKEYVQTGGHAAVRGAVMDDLALGKVFLDEGLPVRCYGGKGIAWLRMYPGGVRDMVQGYSKSMASGSTVTHPAVMALIYVWMAGAFAVPVLLLLTVWEGSFIWIGVSVGLYMGFAVELWIASRRAGYFAWWVFPVYPLLLVVFISNFMYSLYLSKRRGRVTWKGRDLEV